MFTLLTLFSVFIKKFCFDADKRVTSYVEWCYACLLYSQNILDSDAVEWVTSKIDIKSIGLELYNSLGYSQNILLINIFDAVVSVTSVWDREVVGSSPTTGQIVPV